MSYYHEGARYDMGNQPASGVHSPAVGRVGDSLLVNALRVGIDRLFIPAIHSSVVEPPMQTFTLFAMFNHALIR